MLKYFDKNLKPGNKLIYIKKVRGKFNKHIFEDTLTLNHYYIIKKFQIGHGLKNDERAQYVTIIDDRNKEHCFMIGSSLSECFETLQDNRKHKSKKLNDTQ